MQIKLRIVESKEGTVVMIDEFDNKMEWPRNFFDGDVISGTDVLFEVEPVGSKKILAQEILKEIFAD